MGIRGLGLTIWNLGYSLLLYVVVGTPGRLMRLVCVCSAPQGYDHPVWAAVPPSVRDAFDNAVQSLITKWGSERVEKR